MPDNEARTLNQDRTPEGESSWLSKEPPAPSLATDEIRVTRKLTSKRC